MKSSDSPDPSAGTVPAAARHDGWTRQRRRCFLDVLSATLSVSRACAAAGMSRTSAYRLRRREPAGFGLAWAFCLAAPPMPAPISRAALNRQLRANVQSAKGAKGAKGAKQIGITRWHQLHQLRDQTRTGEAKPSPGR